MSRLRHAAVSLAIVLMAYWIYALLAVPLIEPGIAGPSASSGEGGTYEPGDNPRIKQFTGMFPPDAWELNNPITLENDKILLLLKNYKNLNDGRVQLDHCTMIFLWDGPAQDEAQRIRQSVILEARDGAILKFDPPIDPSSLRIGRLVGGNLLGLIKIRSGGKSPGPEDDLLIQTRDVQLDEQKVWTPNPVKFTWGKTYGSGQDMNIKLLADPSKVGSDLNAPNVAGVEVFEIRHIEQLHLESNSTASTGASPPTPSSASSPIDVDLPVEITCNGAFTFNVVKRVATFADGVNISRVNPNGPSDHIQCERLSIFFLPKDKSTPESDNSSDLEPEQIEARGHPVVITAPTKNLTAQGERLIYNLKTSLIALDGGPEVFLRQGPNEIRGRSLKYQYLGPNRLGAAEAKGPGLFCGQMDDKSDQRIEARWNDQLQLSPQNQNHLLSFTGGAALDYAGIGHLQAEKIFFWFKQTPENVPSGQPRVQPLCMTAQNQVSLDSSQFAAAVEQLEVWFDQKDSPQGVRWKGESKGETTQTQEPLGNPSSTQFIQPGNNPLPTGRNHDIQQRTAYRPPLNMPGANTNYIAAAPRQQFQPGQQVPVRQPWQMSPSSPLQPAPRYPGYLPQPTPAQPTNQNPPVSGQENTADQSRDVSAQSDAPKQHIKISGRILRARLQLQDQQNSSLAEIMIEDGVRLEETQTLMPGERPILIQGDRLHGTDVSSPNATVSVTGRPAHFEGRSLGITGSNINLDRAANRLWIDGPGRMDLPLSGNMAGQQLIPGQPINMPGTMFIEWKNNMFFDGRTAKFEESVSATSPQLHLQTKTLEVKLKYPLNLSDAKIKNPDQTEIEELHCYDEVFLESNSTDPQQQRISYDRMKVADLAINMQSGALTAGGPGWLNSVQLGSANPMQNQLGAGLFGGRPAAPAANSGPANTAQPNDQLNCLHVRFQNSIKGNIRQGELIFSDHIRAAYAPVLDWSAMLDPDRQENQLQGMLLNCNVLQINQMPLPGGNGKSIEVIASENAIVEGKDDAYYYTARGHRITFAQAKNLLILEGNGRTDAELFRQPRPGAEISRSAAQKFEFNIKTKSIRIINARSLDINLNNK